MRRVHRSVVFVLVVCLLAASALIELVSAGPATKKRLNPKEEALIELGRRLFFDPLVSRSGQRSCASCHDPDHGFSDPGRVSEDDFGRTRRHSQTLLDGHLNPTAHWDGEFERVEELVLARIGALKGRKSKLGHGVRLSDVILGGMSDVFESDVEPDTPTTIFDEEDEPTPGGNDDDDTPYGGPDSGSASAPSARSADGAGAAKAAPAKPDAGKPANKAEAAKPKPQKKAEPKKKAEPQKKKAAEEEVKRPSAEELRKRAAALRRELKKLPLAAHRLESAGLYAEGFRAAFGSPSISTARIARAIGAYCRSIESTTSPFDRYQAGEADALSASARRGLELFRGRARCATCHTMEGRHPTFTDFAFHNTGVTWHGLSKKQRARLGGHDEVFERTKDDLERPRKVDEGRARISTLRRDLRAFKTPTLRDLTRRGPYMHDGRFKTLADVVRYYSRGGSDDPTKDERIHAFAISEGEVQDLVAFLESLTGDVRPGLPARAWRERADATRLRFVDAAGRPLPDLQVQLTPVGDLAAQLRAGLPQLTPQVTDTRGWITFPRTERTHVRLGLPEGLAPLDVAMVPDTCRKATIVVPVRGRAVVTVKLPLGLPVPATLVAEHQGTVVLPGHTPPRTRLERGVVLEAAGSQIARFEGWMRTDVPARVSIRIPGVPGAVREVELSAKAPVRVDVSRKP